MRAKLTQRRWKVAQDDYSIITEGGDFVGTMETKDAARLTSLAPELLEALTALMLNSSPETPAGREALDMAIKVLAKTSDGAK